MGALAVGAFGADTAVAADRYVFMGGDYYDVWRSYDDGQWTKNLTECATRTDCNYANPALSPTGQTIALDTGWSSIALMDINGRHERLLVDDQVHEAYNPEFTPDGLRVTFTAEADDGEGTDVFSMRTLGDATDGSDRELVLGGPGNQEDLDFTTDGTRVAYSDQAGPGDAYKLYTADGDGSARHLIDTSAQISGSVFEPKWSPDGTRITFYARPVPRTWPPQPDDDHEIWMVNADGSGLVRVTDDAIDEYAPEWSPSGNLLIFDRPIGSNYEVWVINPDGTGAHRVPHSTPEADVYSAEATWRRPSSTLDGKDFQAAEFRPELLFDAGEPGERFRPLNVDSFFAEGHDVCGVAGCQAIYDVDTLRTFPTGASLDINGDGDQTDYRSPDPECNDAVRQDCDSDGRSAIYYHVVEPSPSGYRYFNYWIFYRYNAFPGPIGDHEGDWEDVSIAAAQTGSGLDTFDFATFSQHGHHFSYLRDNLSCDESGKGSCGSETDRSGKRVRVYVAAGSHANYAEPCGGPCTQTNSFLPETDHDGERPWGRNFHDPADSLLELPSARPSESADWLSGEQNFVDWPGRWGIEGSPASPGNQGAAFWRPWDETECADDDDCAVASSSATGPTAEDSPASCERWLGAGVSAVACDEPTLKAALRHGRLGNGGSFSITARSASRPSASALGIAQMMGSELRTGDQVRLGGRVEQGTALLLRVRHAKQAYAARFKLEQAVQGAATLQITSDQHAVRGGARASKPSVSLRDVSGRSVEATELSPVSRP